MEELKKIIRDIPDFPKPGILFKDITPLLNDPRAFQRAVDALVERHGGKTIDRIVGIESRGFIFGSALAYRLGVGFVPVRKPGKLPYRT
ncbi:MAG: adenine phosphoribosyltransferase, partial [Deltaproteobacteria bacterium]